MTNSGRIARQILVLVVFVLIVGGIGFAIYRSYVPAPPEPTPDVTVNLSPIQVLSTKLLNVENNDYDFLAKVSNPNTDFGSSGVEYEIRFFNSSGILIHTKTGSFYILPGQTKYVLDSPLRLSELVSRAELIIKSVDWQELGPFTANGSMLVVRNVSYAPLVGNGVFSKAGGEVANVSDFDLNKVDVVAVAIDQSNQPIAANKTEINTFLAHTTRGFEVSWFKTFVGQVVRVDVEANTNIFENSNFLRSYGRQERFKQLY